MLICRYSATVEPLYLRWGVVSGYPQLTIVKWVGPPVGACGGGPARSLDETIALVELVTLLTLRVPATRPDSCASAVIGPSSDRCLQQTLAHTVRPVAPRHGEALA